MFCSSQSWTWLLHKGWYVIYLCYWTIETDENVAAQQEYISMYNYEAKEGLDQSIS